ncbi:MAG: Dyp-type peroxidase [Planctomycetota bacterium]|nr:MAG: Dyp-type peroxidase [Planctomycetota bacterium]
MSQAMNLAQPDLLADAGAHSATLVLALEHPGPDGVRVAAGVRAVAEEVAALDPSAWLGCTVAFGAHLFGAADIGPAPDGLRAFEPVAGATRSAPATGGDLLFHVHADRRDLVFELLLRIRARFQATARVLEEVHGFTYLDSRDLTGFIDGTENPGPEDRAGAALVSGGDHAGGSFVLVQRYVHDLAGWSALAVGDQERAIGRTKPDSQELADDVRPADSHISRVVIEEDGEELEIWRKSFPYGTTGELGLLFIAYARSLAIFDAMLARIFGTDETDETDGSGVHDRLMDFSRPVSGAYFFAPSQARLAALA